MQLHDGNALPKDIINSIELFMSPISPADEVLEEIKKILEGERERSLHYIFEEIKKINYTFCKKIWV